MSRASNINSTQSVDSALEDEQVAAVAKIAAELQAQFPDQKINTAWLTPAMQFRPNVQARLGDETLEKLNVCAKRVIDGNFEESLVEEALRQGREYLVGHNDLLEQYEAIFSNRERWAEMSKITKSREEGKKEC